MAPLNGALTCLLCNYVLGYVTDGVYRPINGERQAHTSGRPRCPRCGGSVYFDEETHPAVNFLGGGGLPSAREA